MSTERVNEVAEACQADGRAQTVPVQSGQKAGSLGSISQGDFKNMMRTQHRAAWLAQWREVPESLEGPPPTKDARAAREAIMEAIDMDFRAFVVLVGAEFEKLGPTPTEQDILAAIDRANAHVKPLDTKLDLMTGWLLKVAKGRALLTDIPPRLVLSREDALALNLYGWEAVLPRLGIKSKKPSSGKSRANKRTTDQGSDSPREQKRTPLASMLQSTFISYGGPDELFAERLNDALLKGGVSTFFFPKDALPGRKLHRLMRDGVNQHDRVILICSRASLDRFGVLNEITETLQREARVGGAEFLIPITLDDYVFRDWNPPDPGVAQAIRDRVVADFRGASADAIKFSAGLAKLLAALKK